MGGVRCAELDNLCTLVPPPTPFILRAESAIRNSAGQRPVTLSDCGWFAASAQVAA
jgi:hypothetical protein